MGGCCSKCGGYLLGPPTKDGDGATPQLTSRLEHKQSFNKGGVGNGSIGRRPTGENSKPLNGSNGTNGHGQLEKTQSHLTGAMVRTATTGATGTELSPRLRFFAVKLPLAIQSR